MGPPEFTGGNPAPSSPSPSTNARLQWGRRNSPAETCLHDPVEDAVLAASMGPPEFTGGNTARTNKAGIPPRHASMGPPEFTGGNHCHLAVLAAVVVALQWGRRNSPAETRTAGACRWCRAPRFNGAAGIHRRKQETGRGSTPTCWALQWGRRNSPAETRQEADGRRSTYWCFNGAAGIHRRKPQRSTAQERNRPTASMGPPEFTGGNSVRAAPRLRPSPCFNGAAGIHRRKPAWLQGVRNDPSYRLQWGRRNSPAETPAPPVNAPRRTHASMGPPEFTGGNIWRCSIIGTG